MQAGEKRFAQRLEAKLEDDYLCWFDVPLGGARNQHPDFIILHPRRGILILEVKDWKIDTLQAMTKLDASIFTDAGLKHVPNPLEQARQYAHVVANRLQRDPQLIFTSGREEGKLRLPWAYGVVFSHMTRKQFDDGQLGEVIPENLVICADEMTEAVDAEAFQARLWQMFRIRFTCILTLPQIDRIRWQLFPEVRISATQATLFDGAEGADDAENTHLSAQLPEIMQVMDLQQEQLARSLGDGHRVIHGVAGSGKTLILGYRAEYLARAATKPILILCYNKTLAARLEQWMHARGVGDKVVVRNFHSWCRAQLIAYNVDLPGKEADTDAFMAAMVQAVIDASTRGQIPAGQYEAVLVDEGHDFRPEWLRLIVQMVDPRSNALLILYDDAQSIYDAGKKRNFSFKSAGVQAQGRTTILKVNYRNTQEVLKLAMQFAAACLAPSDADEDGVPRLAPLSAGRHGDAPLVIKLPTLEEEGAWIARHLTEAHQAGTAWRDMAVLYRHYDPTCKTVRAQLRKLGIPVTWKDDIRFNAEQDTVRLMPFHSSKGLEFPLVVIPGAGTLAGMEAEEDEARLLYVAMTRATERLVLVGSGA
ncbi:nuclease-related domain-containing DEAD/DEAH box helicase [Uliginosibacterium flavum]